MDAHVVQLRDSCVVYPPDVLRNLAADVACVIKHHFREYHPVEWFVMFEGKENCCDTILAKRTRGYVLAPLVVFVFHRALLFLDSRGLVV